MKANKNTDGSFTVTDDPVNGGTKTYTYNPNTNTYDTQQRMGSQTQIVSMSASAGPDSGMIYDVVRMLNELRASGLSSISSHAKTSEIGSALSGAFTGLGLRWILGMAGTVVPLAPIVLVPAILGYAYARWNNVMADKGR